ncbi:MAG: hypothetical protein AAB654_09190 [Acidobacteriota bacterium]
MTLRGFRFGMNHVPSRDIPPPVATFLEVWRVELRRDRVEEKRAIFSPFLTQYHHRKGLSLAPG